jgi:thioesterase domain-containing protein
MESRGNPALLQQGNSSLTPLFLIHDSSGGIFNYLKLEPLGRPVYTIYNPWFRNIQKWDGGTILFVEKYIELIKTIKRRGDILIGGAQLS